MKRIIILLTILAACLPETHAVLKERDLDQTLEILRSELTEFHRDLTGMSNERKQQNEQIFNQLMETMRQSNQNALMLYSQKQNYVFDMTYACHQATEQYHEFKRTQIPFQKFLKTIDTDIAKYDSLVSSLTVMPQGMLSERAKVNRNVCLTLATNIRNTLAENREQVTDYIRYYEVTESRLKYLNDYANQRYNDIQTSIFRNGGRNYFAILKSLRNNLQETKETIEDKYKSTSKNSQWDSSVIFGLFGIIALYIVIAIALNIIAFRFLLPKRLHTTEFLKKRTCIIFATTTITFAIILGILRATLQQNFFIMASDLLIEYAWLLGVFLISLLLRVSGEQIKSAFRIYAPLIVIGFIVISFRIILIPNELVDLIFPPTLLVCSLWQWNVIRRHNQNVPRSDMFYTYISLTVFLASVALSWTGYTLLSVQLLIWWIMQLTCVLTITCVSQYVHLYGSRHGLDDAPITKSWFYKLFYNVALPVMGVLSVMVSIYWAADVFNLSDLCMQLFQRKFIDTKNLSISILKLSMVVNLWFLFRYVSNTILEFLRLHYQQQDPTTAQSREVMGRNVIQVLVWGIWLLMSLSILNISVTWLVAISGGLSTGIGFASKDIIENIYYGASLMAGRVKVGDWIEVDGTMGKVASISYTSTVVESLYGEVITFQNSQLFAKNYKNLTKNHGYVLAVVPFGVAYGSNLKQVSQLVEEAVNDLHHEWMDPEKKVKSVVAQMNDSSIDFKLFVWADAVKKSYVVSDVLKCVYDTLGRNGIEIPFPQRDVHIINNS
ncbi:MAG: mechanosensitive ion channel family protein [Prevotella sp.]|nr:mechanosensitive ion channel family protein [Prevotella sp.]